MRPPKFVKVHKIIEPKPKTGRPRKERKAFNRGVLNISVPQPTAAEPPTKENKKGTKINNLTKLKAIKLRLHLESQGQQGSERYRQVIAHLNKFS